MKYSKLLIPTLKEVPSEAEIPSHRLMIRAGYIRKVASGTYTYLVLGARSLRKIMQIVREEIDAAGAQEIIMPIVQPMELWEATGRKDDYGETLGHFIDRHGRDNALSPTAEEVCTFHASGEIKSYKQLPINLYQINTKYRDEFRPRFGVLRSREFIMKDAYSFDADEAGLDVSYRAMYDAYCRILTRCGVPYVIVEAASGEIGGTGSHEFMIPCDAGEDTILASDKGNYAANVEKCAVGDRPATLDGPPTGDLEKVHTPDMKSIDDVGGFMKVKPKHLLKTLVFRSGERWVIGVVRGDHELSEDKFRGMVDGPVELADDNEAIAAGFVIGFVGPHVVVGRDDVTLYVDPDAAAEQFWAGGANEKDHHVKHFNWRRDVLDPLGDAAEGVVKVADIRSALDGDPSPMNDGGVLCGSKGIETGHIFKLGTKYSEKLGATFLDENGAEQVCLMGCYGIGINRILAAAIEVAHDDNGCILPATIAPFEVEIVAIGPSDEVAAESERLYAELLAAGVDVLLDDRKVRPGVKFNDADLIGIPLRVVVGDRGLKEGQIEIKRRAGGEQDSVPPDEVVSRVRAILAEMHASPAVAAG